MVPAPPIITCPQWQARRPTRPPQLAGRPVRIIEHHTAGHGPANSSTHPDKRQQAIAYAHQLQAQHMDVNGWADSGHNFLVMRSGLIVQGRWGTVTAIEHGRMVTSAHCPGQNDQPGVEHENAGEEELTAAQHEATVALQAWICDRTGIRPTELYGHRVYYPTACPGAIADQIGRLRLDVAAKLNEHGRGKPARRSLLLARSVRSHP